MRAGLLWRKKATTQKRPVEVFNTAWGKNRHNFVGDQRKPAFREWRGSEICTKTKKETSTMRVRSTGSNANRLK